MALVVAAADGDPRPDVDFVDALARLELAARRLGWALRLTETSAELAALLDLTGLAGVVGGVVGGSGERLRLEADRQAEGREQLGEQEVVPPHDAPA